LCALVERDGESVLKLIDDAYNFGYDEKRLCQNLLELVRDLSVMKNVKDAETFLDRPAQEVEALKKIVNSIGSEELQLYFKYLSQGLDEISRASYSRVVLEMTFLKIVGLPSFKSLSDIIHRLGDLEKMSGVELAGDIVHGATESRVKSDYSSNKPAISTDETLPKIDGEKKGDEEPLETYVEKKEAEGSTVKDLGWEDFLKFVFKKKPALGSQLNSATVLSIDDKKVVLGVRKGYLYDYLTDDDAMDSLKDLSGAFFKEPVSIKIEELSNGEEEVAAVGATLDRGRKLKSGKDNKLKENFIEDVTEVFGGDIHEINEENV
jgi:DNA polymerase III gamma/tau subunit